MYCAIWDEDDCDFVRDKVWSSEMRTYTYSHFSFFCPTVDVHISVESDDEYIMHDLS